MEVDDRKAVFRSKSKKEEDMKVLAWTLAILGAVGLITLGIVSGFSAYHFNRGCTDYLKLTGDAPTIEKADAFLEKAIDYIEANGKTRGNSAYVFQRPATDIGIWYEQIKGQKVVLDTLISDGDKVTNTDRSNALIKVREVVIDEGSSGSYVTLPNHIAIFPSQVAYFVLYIIFGLMWGIGCILFFPAYVDS